MGYLSGGWTLRGQESGMGDMRANWMAKIGMPKCDSWWNLKEAKAGADSVLCTLGGDALN